MTKVRVERYMAIVQFINLDLAAKFRGEGGYQPSGSGMQVVVGGNSDC